MMECKACGHKKNKVWEGGDLVEEYPDNDEFIEIEGSFHTEPDGYRRSGKKEVDLYGCPECGTVLFRKRF